jgi:hypothetical protein
MECPPEQARVLVEEVLRVGMTLFDLVSNLIDMLPDDAFPGEDLGVIADLRRAADLADERCLYTQ